MKEKNPPRTVKEMQRQAAMKVGKGSNDTRTISYEERRRKLASIFGERCPRCGTNSKQVMSDGKSWCNICNRRFIAL